MYPIGSFVIVEKPAQDLEQLNFDVIRMPSVLFILHEDQFCMWKFGFFLKHKFNIPPDPLHKILDYVIPWTYL
jgi:hypothetical protein